MPGDSAITARDALTSRSIPRMTLSTEDNPLTAPLLTPVNLSSSDRAIERFAVRGNAIITGGSGALGLSCAQALLEHGCQGICLFDLKVSHASSAESVDKLCHEFAQAKIICKTVDVTDEKAVAEAVEETATELGSIDILLCFAGVVGTTHSLDVTAREFRRVMDINLTGSWLAAQAVGRQMIQQGSGGSIVLTASISGHQVNFPQPQVAYNASKAAVLQTKSSLAAEWARYGIRVNSISPGYMNTILNEGPGLDEIKPLWYERNPMGRMGEPSELSGVVILLCSAAGRFINGTDILVDGGGHVF